MGRKLSKQNPPQKAQKSPQEAAPKERKEIPLVSIPDEDDVIAQEMAELFEEDQVTHKHGSTEPEAD
jgi:hypothetical protein